MRNALKFTGAAVLLSSASSAHALTQYSQSLDFLAPGSWSSNSLYSTMQQWDTRPGAETPTTSDNFPWTAAPPVNGTNNTFDNNNHPAGTSLGNPILSITTAFNDTPYLFSGGSPVATIPNYGSGSTPVDTIYTGTHVIVQLAAAPGSEADDVTQGQSVNPGTMQIRSADGATVLASESTSDPRFLRKTLINSVNSGLENPVTGSVTVMDTWIFEFFLPNYTGGFRATWNHDPHTVFEAVRVDSALTTGQALANTPVFQPLFWDTDGATPGAGGATPSGNWDGVASNFTPNPTGEGTTTPETLSTRNVTFTAGTDGTGSYTVNVSGTQSAASVIVPRGVVTFSGGTINTGAFDVASGSTAIVSSAVTGGSTSTITKTGAGTLKLYGVNTHTGGTNISAGLLVIGNADALGTGSLSLASSAGAQVQPNLPKAVSVSSLGLADSTAVDLTNGSLVVKNSDLATVQAMVTSGYAASAWNGPGINSSVAANDPNFVTAIGYASNADAFLTAFEGVTGLDSDDVLVRVTSLGDSDLNGDTNLDDFPLFTAGLEDDAPGGADVLPSTWFYGDYDYNGVVNLDDFPLFTYGLENDPIQLAALGDLIEMSNLSTDQKSAMLGMLAAVPEPATFALLSVAACGGLLHRRRRTV